jgi:hypothetical protein
LTPEHKLQSLVNRADSCSNVTFEPFMLGKWKQIKKRASQQILT